jgi:HK97 family phage prohead protease
MFKALPEDLKMGDYVSWGTSASDARGKIVDIRTDGEVESSISGYTLTGTPRDPVYVIKLVQKDQDGRDVLTEQTVIHRADALTKIPDPIKSMKTFFSPELKAKENGVVEGYLVRFGNPNDTDLEKDYFTKSTDFGFEFDNGESHKLGLYYNHGMDKVLGTKKIGYGEVKMDDKGLWYSAQLNMADEYSKMIYDLAKKGQLGFSSGSASHMVEREMMGKAYEIKRWALAEASLTPTPAEYRNKAEAKRYFDEEGRFVDYTEKEKREMSKKSEDEYEEEREVDDMVEGLMMINATPEEIASTIYDGVEEDLVSDSIHCLYKRMIEGVLGVVEAGGDIATINAIIQGFHDRALGVAEKYVVMPEAQMSMEMEAMKTIVAKSPENIKQCERALRDAMDLSRSQAKGLAKLVWNHLRDVSETQEPEIKQTEINVDKEAEKNALLTAALKYLI